MNSYYTHQKYLIKELTRLDYTKPVTVLEFGTGDGSASVLQEFAKRFSNLRIESYESDFNWLWGMEEKYSSGNYHFHYVDSWDGLEMSQERCDLAFVDAGDWDARIKIIDCINAKVIILHDYDFYNKGIIEDIFSTSEGSFFEKYSKDFILKGNYEILPPTLIMTRI